MNIKTWLETTGESVAEDVFQDAVELPHIVFNDEIDRFGADSKLLCSSHNVTVERYSDGTGDEAVEALLEEEVFEYTKNRVWLDDEQCFMTTYEFNYTE